jgi:hypothetical protein
MLWTGLNVLRLMPSENICFFLGGGRHLIFILSFNHQCSCQVCALGLASLRMCYSRANKECIFFFLAQQPNADQGRLILEVPTVGRTPLDEGSGRRRDPYLTTHKTHKRHPCPQRDSVPQFPASELPQTRRRPPGHWNWHKVTLEAEIKISSFP